MTMSTAELMTHGVAFLPGFRKDTTRGQVVRQSLAIGQLAIRLGDVYDDLRGMHWEEHG